ncbi:MAG: rRNA pseudouridine synthase [Lachnospiraceae bacterium]|nr:rRNA pseudouridine synthase [Lachnospiraceae bacterium]
MRLDKYLTSIGVGSRSEVKKEIKKGNVTVNGKLVLSPEEKINENEDEICFKGKNLTYSEFEYFMLNKPKGYVSATEDNLHPTVTALIKNAAHKDIFPVGRLDIDTEGLLLITNDGELSHNLLSPKKHVDKTYYAIINGKVTEEDVATFAEPMDLGAKSVGGSKVKKQQDASNKSVGESKVKKQQAAPNKSVGKSGIDKKNITQPAKLQIIDYVDVTADNPRFCDNTDPTIIKSEVLSDDIEPKNTKTQISDNKKISPLEKETDIFENVKPLNDKIITEIQEYIRVVSDNEKITQTLSDTFTTVYVTIKEGKFHQIKRMFEHVGKKVIYLKRISMGTLILDESLQTGEYRALTDEEVDALKNRNF